MRREEDKLRNRFAYWLLGMWPKRVTSERLTAGERGATQAERVTRALTDPRRR